MVSHLAERFGMRHLALTIAAVAAASILPLRAATAGNLAPDQQQTWKNMDSCYKQSFLKFPDQTKEGEEQRKKFVKTCQIQPSITSPQAVILRN